jgi:hypothetical protein
MGTAVSRLLLLIRGRDVPRDYPALWTTLLLSPFVGALAAYGGVLLTATLRELDLLGDAAKAFAWPAQDTAPAAALLGLAFLFGFSERLLDRVARRAEAGLAPSQSSASAPSNPPPAPMDGGPESTGSAPPGRGSGPSGEAAPPARNSGTPANTPPAPKEP